MLCLHTDIRMAVPFTVPDSVIRLTTGRGVRVCQITFSAIHFTLRLHLPANTRLHAVRGVIFTDNRDIEYVEGQLLTNIIFPANCKSGQHMLCAVSLFW